MEITLKSYYMFVRNLSEKMLRKFRYKIIHYFRFSPVFPFLYRSYWHYLLLQQNDASNIPCYYTARPNPGAGIGHQIANWTAGFWYAKQFGLKYAHYPFSSPEWDEFLGFGKNEITVPELKEQGYKIRRLPLFDQNNPKEFNRCKNIIKSYKGRIIFLAEQDQFYMEQYGVMADIKQKFFSSPARKKNRFIYSVDTVNIAIHVRRGDIMTDKENPNLSMRYISNVYYKNVLSKVIDNLQTRKTIHIYFLSQGTPDDYPEFSIFQNLHWCLDMDAYSSFLHMVYADVLITSKSSFSYKPALLNNGIKICPKDFWHGYPSTDDWILADENGNFDINKLVSTSKLTRRSEAT